MIQKPGYDPACWAYISRIHYLHKSHNTVHLGGLLPLKQWISCSLKHDTVPRVNNLYCFYVKNPQDRLHYNKKQYNNLLNSRRRSFSDLKNYLIITMQMINKMLKKIKNDPLEDDLLTCV